MKNMKKLLQKAMVFTLTAAMLIGTPLTASAAGLVDLYKVEDGWGNVIEQNGSDDTRTGTVTATQTNSGVLLMKGVLQGIGLSEENVVINTDEVDEGELTAYLEWDGDPGKDVAGNDWNDKLLKNLKWSSSNNNIVAVKVPNGSYNGGSRETIKLVPKATGTANVTVSLESSKYPEISKDFRATATVKVVQYADELKFKIPEDEAVTGNALVLDQYVTRLVDGKETDTPDEITYALINDQNKAVTLKNGVLSLKKATGDNKVIVRAMGKKADAKADAEFKITAGVNATKVTFSSSSDGTTIKGSTLTQLANDGLRATVTAKVAGKKFGDTADKTANKPCTDKITWSSANSSIVAIENQSGKFENDTCNIELIFKSAGKTQLTGKTSAGKSFKLNATVNAELTGVILDEGSQLYTGQIIDLNDKIKKQKFETEADSDSFTADGLVKWEFTDKKTMPKVAKLNAKTGVLEILPDLEKKGGPTDKRITVRAVAAKKNKSYEFKATDNENEISFSLEPVNITSISVIRGENTADNANPLVSIVSKAGENPGKQTPKSITDSISVGKTKTYKLVAKGMIGTSSEEVDVTDALGWTASGNGKIIIASKKGNIGSIRAVKKGTAAVTVSGTTRNKNDKPVAIKLTFKEKVNAPTQTVALSVKNTGIAMKYKGKTETPAKQTVTITAKFDKGSDTKSGKNKNVKWYGTVTDEAGNNVTSDRGGIMVDDWTGKVTLSEDGYRLGDKIRVTAKVINGPSASITLTVVKPSKSVAFKGDTVTKKGIEFVSADAAEQTVTPMVIFADKSEGTPGQDNTANVTYTMNKAGIARIVEDKLEGTITIYPLAKGKVSITAKTSDGKTGKLNVTVK